MTEPRKLRAAILPTRFQPKEFVHNEFHVSAETGTTSNDLLDPSYWSHVAAQLNRFDHIEVTEETGAWWAELIVASSKLLENKARVIRVEVLHFVELGKAGHGESESKSNYEVKFRGPRKWSVLRIHDREIMVENLDSEIEAKEWVKTNGVELDKAA